MKFYRISQNIQYLQSIGVPQENTQTILDTLLTINKSIRPKYIKYLKEHPTTSPQQLLDYQPLTKEDYLKQKVPQEIINWAKNIDLDYYEWIIKQYLNKSAIPKEDDKKITNAVLLFKDLKNKNEIPQKLKDINQFETLPKLLKELKKYQGVESSRIIIDDKDPDLVYNQNDVQILQLKDPTRAANLAKGTGWCTEEEETAANYLDQEGELAPLYVLIVDGVKTAQIHPASNQFKDINDGRFQNWDLIDRIQPALEKLHLIRDEGDFATYNEGVKKSKEINQILSQPNGFQEYLQNKQSKIINKKIRGIDQIEIERKIMEDLQFINQTNLDNNPDIKEYMIKAFVPLINITVNKQAITSLYKNKTSTAIRNIPEIRSAFAQTFLNVILDTPYEYDEIGNELKKLPEIQKARKQGWIKQIKDSPKKFQWVPEEIKKDPEIKQIALEGWIEKIRFSDSDHADCPIEFQKSPEILNAAVECWTKYFNLNPTNVTAFFAEDLPLYLHPILKNTTLQNAMKNAWIKTLQSSENVSRDYKYCPLYLRTLPEIKMAYKQGWIQYLKDKALNHYDSIVPEELQQLPDILDAYIDGWMSYISINPSLFIGHFYFG